jgi:diguanylate cyclase (GGDEF)-like protein
VSTEKRLLWVVVSAAIIAVIGLLDYETGPDIGFSLFYLIPVAVCGWFGGVGPAVIVACFAGACWLAADLGWRDAETTTIAVSAWNAFTRFVIYVSEGVFIALLRRDREQLQRLAARESALARTDSHTGLPNVRAFLERAEREIDTARRKGRPLCALYVDLDNFKLINDRLGHAAGDALLEEVARILGEAVGERDFAARIGGDEFALLLCCETDPQAAQELGAQLTERIRALASVYGDLGFGATIGIACFKSAPDNAEELLRTADGAMYEGKMMGKGRVVVQEGQNV